jgi:hypothetical protein
MERVTKQPTFEEFRLVEPQVPLSIPKSIEGFSFEFELGKRMVQELRSSTKESMDLMTQTNTPKSTKKVVAKVMKVDKVDELF